MKHPPLFITGTGTGVGKTFVTCTLIDALGLRGIPTAALKPIETGVVERPEDGSLLSHHLGLYAQNPQIPLETIVSLQLPLPAAPAVAIGQGTIEWGPIVRAFEWCQDRSDILLIEGAGGALSPLEGDRPLIDLADRFKAKVLVVVHDRLGMIHDLLATLEAIRVRGHEPIWCVSRRTEGHFESESLPWLEAHLGQVLQIPRDRDQLLEKVLSLC